MASSDPYLHAGLTPATDVELYASAPSGNITPVTAAVTTTGTATVTKSVTYARTFAVTATGTATLAKTGTLSRTFTVTTTGVATLTRTAALARTFTAATVGTATVGTANAFARTFAVTATGTATVSTSFIPFVPPSARYGEIDPGLNRKFVHRLRVAQKRLQDEDLILILSEV